jgi:hypothetical protein
MPCPHSLIAQRRTHHVRRPRPEPQRKPLEANRVNDRASRNTFQRTIELPLTRLRANMRQGRTTRQTSDNNGTSTRAAAWLGHSASDYTSPLIHSTYPMLRRYWQQGPRCLHRFDRSHRLQSGKAGRSQTYMPGGKFRPGWTQLRRSCLAHRNPCQLPTATPVFDITRLEGLG